MKQDEDNHRKLLKNNKVEDIDDFIDLNKIRTWYMELYGPNGSHIIDDDRVMYSGRNDKNSPGVIEEKQSE